MAKYGYARVSTAAQDLSGQIELLKSLGCQEVFSEKVTGSKIKRPEFQKVLDKLKDGDTLLVTKLDRFARSSIDAQLTVQTLIDRGVKVDIHGFGICDNSIGGKAFFQLLCMFAEMERNLIIERTQAGKAIARTREGFKEGRKPVYTPEQKAHALELLEQGRTFKEVCKMTGMSKSLIVKERVKAATL